MIMEQCEMCGKRNKTVHDGQCLSCHIEICDMPLSECQAKQDLYLELSPLGRDVEFEIAEVVDYEGDLKAQAQGDKA